MVFFYGMLTIVFAAFCNKFPGILIAAYSLLGAISGPVLGVFTLGLLFPFANSRVCFFFFLVLPFANIFCFVTIFFYLFFVFKKKRTLTSLFFTCEFLFKWPSFWWLGLVLDNQQTKTTKTFAKCITFILVNLIYD